MQLNDNKYLSLPNRKEGTTCIIALVVWLAVTAAFIGFRSEHIVLAVLIAALFFVSGVSRRLIVALIPFCIFGISYDWMKIVPNYEVNPIDVAGLYNTEKALFGITTDAGVLTPNEFFALHTSTIMDFMAGVFYLCWVPLPIIFGLWLYAKGMRSTYLRFAMVFLFVNLIGFAFYYVHPAAPPWYVALYGMEPILNTPGDVAGLGAFDDMTGLGIFHGLYARNSNVFAALPSLHSAYTLVAFIYSLRCKCGNIWRVILGIVTLGIWFTAVYTSHHYIIDVTGGIACAVIGFLIFEYILMRIPAFARFVDRYTAYVSPVK